VKQASPVGIRLEVNAEFILMSDAVKRRCPKGSRCSCRMQGSTRACGRSGKLRQDTEAEEPS
jgi:hypothetical protein